MKFICLRIIWGCDTPQCGGPTVRFNIWVTSTESLHLFETMVRILAQVQPCTQGISNVFFYLLFVSGCISLTYKAQYRKVLKIQYMYIRTCTYIKYRQSVLYIFAVVYAIIFIQRSLYYTIFHFKTSLYFKTAYQYNTYQLHVFNIDVLPF